MAKKSSPPPPATPPPPHEPPTFESTAELHHTVATLVLKGKSHREIAQILEISAGYVSHIIHRIRQSGEYDLPAPRTAGRKKIIDPSPVECTALEKTLRAPPAEAGFPDDEHWDDKMARAWFKKTYRRPLAVTFLHAFLKARSLEFRPKPVRYGELFKIRTKPDRRRKIDKFYGLEFTVSPEEAEQTIDQSKLLPDQREVARQFMRLLGVTEPIAIQMASNAAADQAAAAKAAGKTSPPPPPPGPPPPPVRHIGPKLGRNDPCPYDSTKKFKRCCGAQNLTYCQRAADEAAAKNPPTPSPSSDSPLPASP